MTDKQPTILETIYAQRAKDVDAAKSTAGTTPADISALLSMNLAPPLIPLVSRLKRNPSTPSPSPSPSLMAEIKRASPSKGPIALSTNAAAQALTYALAGASVISVLTEPTWFKGSLLDLRLARQAIDALPDRPAILRKEFILDEYQIAEARLHGADTVLLIVAMLPPERLTALYAYSLGLGMEPLVEVNNAREMELALALGAKVIGVNNRNLHDFQVDMGTTSRLVEMVKERDVILCALSGISSPADVQVYKEQGVRAVLIGEALMRATDTSAFIRNLLQWPEPELEPEKKQETWVMVSGVQNLKQAKSLAEAGADLLSLIFDSNSASNVKLEEAAAISKELRAHRSPSPSPATTPTPSLSPAPWLTAQKRNLQLTGVRPLLVGTFRSPTLPDILHTIASAQLDLVQVDESVPDGWIPHIPVPVIRRFRIGNTAEVSRPGLHSFALVDLGVDGGNLQKAAEVIQAGEAVKWPAPIILSGGLTTQNVREAIEAVGPWAVETSVEDGLAGDAHDFLAALKGAHQ